MAVVYADLRFTRAPGQTAGVTQEPVDENWEVIYENVTDPKRRKDQNRSQRMSPRGFLALPPCVTITLILLSCTLTAAVIGLSVQLSQVSGHLLSTAATLQELQGEHEDLGSRFTQNNLRKDSVLQENQRELEKTKAELQEVQEKWKTSTQELQRTRREKEDTETTQNTLQNLLLSTEEQLKGKHLELTQCEYNLRSVRTEKMTLQKTLTLRESFVKVTQKNLHSTESTLSQKNRELSHCKQSLQETQRNLDTNIKYSEQKDKKLRDLEQRLIDAGKCLTTRACSDILNIDENISDSFNYCFPGWHQLGEMCYYFSSVRKPRIDAVEDCSSRSASLARVEDELIDLKGVIERTKESYWIGLYKNENSWESSDGTKKKDFQARGSHICVKATPRLEMEPCRTELPWICETRAKRCSCKAEALRCAGEKIGVFGEKRREQ